MFCIRYFDYSLPTLLSPKSELPTLTTVLPLAIAFSQSLLIPIDSFVKIICDGSIEFMLSKKFSLLVRD